MDRAKEEVERQSSAGPFAGFVLLSTPEWDLEAFKAQLKADWDIDYPPADGEQSGENDDTPPWPRTSPERRRGRRAPSG